MADNRITKQRLRNHWAYGWWKYLLAAVCVVFGVNMLFTVTAYRSPEHKKIELYLCSGWADAEKAQADLWPVLLEIAPDQEELTVMNIDLTSEDYYSVMQFSTYLAAQQGDILLIPRSEMKKYASEGANGFFAELTPYIESGVLSVGDVDLTGMMYENESGEMGVFGIPTDMLYGLLGYGIDPADSVLAVTAYSGNEENCVRLLNAMLSRYHTEKPEDYDALHQQMNSSSGSTTVFY